MNKKLMAILAALIISSSLLAASYLAMATTVFSDNFSNGNFANWSQAYVSSGSTQTVSDGIARFTVPTPTSGYFTYSYVLKSGFTSTVNSTIIAAQDVYVTKVPNGYAQGNGAIFFLYVCDSSDLSGNNGNFGVGIDGSDAWSLWIGGNPIYTYVFQTGGSAPASNTWYHVALTIDNSAGTVALTVNGVVVINVGQGQFTDKTHPITLMSGMGEDWWCLGSGQQEVDVDNVMLDISDASSMPTATVIPTQDPSPPPDTATPDTSPTSSPSLTPQPTSQSTATPTASPIKIPSSVAPSLPPAVPEFLFVYIILLLVLAFVGSIFLSRKRIAKKVKP